MLLDPTYKFIGVGSAKHAVYGSIVVILFAEYVNQWVEIKKVDTCSY